MTQRPFTEHPDARSWNARPTTRFTDDMPSSSLFQGVKESHRTYKVPQSTPPFENEKIASSSEKSQSRVSTKTNDDVSTKDTPSGVTTSGRWTEEEHAAFLRGLALWGRVWTRYQAIIPTRSPAQVRSHAQKYFLSHSISAEEERSSQKALRRQRRNVLAKRSPPRPMSSVLQWKQRCLAYLDESRTPHMSDVQKTTAVSDMPDPRNMPQFAPLPNVENVRSVPQFEARVSSPGPPPMTGVLPSPHAKELMSHVAPLAENVRRPDPPKLKESIPHDGPTLYNDMDELMALQALGLLRRQNCRPPSTQCRSISE